MYRAKEGGILSFFERCLERYERRHGRKPATRDEMWEAITEGMERGGKGNPES